MRYLQKTKEYMFVYRRVDNLEVVGYTNSNLGGCPDNRRSTYGYIFMMDGVRYLGRVRNKLLFPLLLCKQSPLLVLL